MNHPDEKYVFHGSHEFFARVAPKQQRRSRRDQRGEEVVIFDDLSFHATPYRWIAMAYMNSQTPFILDGKNAHYSFGVGLYEYKEIIVVYGIHSLEQSLRALYGNGGYLYSFKKERFFCVQGLGNLEVITKEELTPDKVERIDDPIGELKKAGITFHFVDVSLAEYADKRYAVLS